MTSAMSGVGRRVQQENGRIAAEQTRQAVEQRTVDAGRRGWVAPAELGGDHEQWLAEMERKRQAVEAKLAAKAARRQQARAVQVGRRPTVAQRKAAVREMKQQLKEGGKKPKRVHARSRGLRPRSEIQYRPLGVLAPIQQRVMQAQEQRTGRAPRGLALRAIEQDKRVLQQEVVAAIAGLDGAQMKAVIKATKRLMREKAVEETEKFLDGMEVKFRGEWVTVVKVKKSKVVVLVGLRERKVSPFDLTIPTKRTVPGTIRVGRKELKTVVRAERARQARRGKRLLRKVKHAKRAK